MSLSILVIMMSRGPLALDSFPLSVFLRFNLVVCSRSESSVR